MWMIKSLVQLEEEGLVQLGRGKVISKKDLAANVGSYPVYSSSKVGDGKFGEYGLYMFDEELITWSVDGGGRLFHREKHKFSITNVTGFLRILDTSVLSYKYLFHALCLLHSKINFDWVKKAHPSVLRKEYLYIPIPPLAEQQRIVAKLDAAFAEIDRAVATNEQLIETSKATFKSHLRQIFQSTPTDWIDSNLKDVAEVFDGPHATPKTVDEGPLFLGISSLQDGELILDKTRHVTEEDFLKWTKRVTPKANDFVFSYETRLGQAAIIPKNLKCCLGRRMGLIRFKTDVIDSRFFMYYYISPPYQEFLKSRVKEGATVDRLSIKEFPSFPLKYPSLAEQHSLASRLDAYKEEVEKLEMLYEKKGAQLLALKSAILAQELQPPQSEAA